MIWKVITAIIIVMVIKIVVVIKTFNNDIMILNSVIIW